MTAQPHSAVILSEENFSALVLRNKRPSLVDFGQSGVDSAR